MTTWTAPYIDNCRDYLADVYINKFASVKYRPFLRQVRETVPLLEICLQSPESIYRSTIVADQHAWVVSRATDRYPVIATYALNACIGLVLYQPSKRVAALAHIDGLPGYSLVSARADGQEIDFDPAKRTVCNMLNRMQYLCDERQYDAYLIGGIYGLSEVMIHDLMGVLRLYGVTVQGRNLLGPDNQSRNICFDTRTGAFTHFDYLTNDSRCLITKCNIPKAVRASEAELDLTYAP